MAHAQKTDSFFRRNGGVHLNRRGRRFSRLTTGGRRVRICVSNAGYTMFRGSVKSTVYPLHLPVSPSILLPCVTVCHHISTGLYLGKSGRGRSMTAHFCLERRFRTSGAVRPVS